MNAKNLLKWITAAPKILGGKPIIRGTPLSVTRGRPYTHLLNRGGLGVQSPADKLLWGADKER